MIAWVSLKNDKIEIWVWFIQNWQAICDFTLLVLMEWHNCVTYNSVKSIKDEVMFKERARVYYQI